MLKKVVEVISEKVGKWFRYSWDAAWVYMVGASMKQSSIQKQLN
ncbi:MAG: hypothetical protein MRT15_06080 [archaeon YNP-LCB-003-016]|jgi:hypothetical protein|nr:hypothetical protein [Candidatus Culexarchaeum yellowstonense]MCR6668700.1 hypothetical protein [Candidatus Culexarchaeum yellowstonense]MCR6691936.1 hypothetical protein [Candidatus Culexarchaeum yellowstonense]